MSTDNSGAQQVAEKLTSDAASVPQPKPFAYISPPDSQMPHQLALKTLREALEELETSSKKLEALAAQELGAYVLPPYFRAAAAIRTAAQAAEVQVATVEELVRRVDKHRSDEDR